MDATWGLALSGGVARGIAHIGVLKALEEAKIEVGYVTGTSSGALVAALYAAGVPISEMEDIASHARWRHLVRLTLPWRGLINLTQLAQTLAKITGVSDFSQLSLPLAVVACDITSGEKVVIMRGNLSDALQASCAIPGIFDPVRIGNRLLVDGGLVESLPVQTCRELGAQRVLAVDVSAFRPSGKEPASMFEIIVNTVQILASNQGEQAAAHADAVLYPEVSDLSSFYLDAAKELIARGYRCASEYLATRN